MKITNYKNNSFTVKTAFEFLRRTSSIRGNGLPHRSEDWSSGWRSGTNDETAT